MIATAKMELEARETVSDERLVRECLAGDEQAWSALIDKYKRLIYSIPVKWNLPTEEANDIFQSVCVDLYSELPHLRNPRALPKWLIQTTLHKCARYRRQQARFSDEEPTEESAAIEQTSHAIVEQVEQEQLLRDSISGVGGRCAQLIRMLFFENTARPYIEIARELGLATGSIGFIRGRCLDRLKQQLISRGWK
ncbi:MAG: sigma-70 family RNA polymerase sigma factor [Acidobacteria bacterium]|nr:sigma-70 family RNA polymerase sigma factor [Acidobacteriota bacterium]MBV9145253.1 sigma-70 family RNA polymerase sigma factor [Acidobacteriota bacterium]MBV9437971.1 sigma-70 family RNA polymerase sigma factor [Acidobacteriota bacterium]